MFEYLIMGGQSPVLVDTGTLGGEQALLRQNRILDQLPGMDAVTALKRLRVGADDIKIVINTHLHWDHASGNDRFPRAKIFVQRDEVAHAVWPLPEHRRFYDKIPGVIPSWLKAWDQVEAVSGDREVAPGITLIALPGHSPGSQGVLVRTGTGPFIIAGDNINTFEDWQHRRPPRVITDHAAWLRSVARMEEFGGRVIPSHDLALIDHPPFGL
ncbi:MAG: N-acyl homoserine lactonase family protein [Bifidobacteriaceae bacterium]|jgi:glyoxylase-like metal-dependent hydrolase (beta-lactamase superfamily II)|nr:N-acyl homoserine lactonase family protein [Bifidobacteriaceae bacterium]